MLMAHSLHAYFLLGGDPYAPIVYQVERLRDGRSFATRRCNAIQHGKVIFSLAASFHNPGGEARPCFRAAGCADARGYCPMKASFSPVSAATCPNRCDGIFNAKGQSRCGRSMRGRYVPRGRDADPVQKVWVRTSAPLPDDPAVHRAALAYLSDMTLLDTSLIAHGLSVFHPSIQAASLDHALVAASSLPRR